jgi:hypothetical protein
MLQRLTLLGVAGCLYPDQKEALEAAGLAE